MKNKKEIFNYLLFGVLTTLINIGSYSYFEIILGMEYKLATTIAWIFSVLFAFITNKIYVFNSKKIKFISVLTEFISFTFFRVLSYILDILTMVILIELVVINSVVAKIIANVFVVIFNYFASKFIIFRAIKENK